MYVYRKTYRGTAVPNVLDTVYEVGYYYEYVQHDANGGRYTDYEFPNPSTPTKRRRCQNELP